MEGDKTPIIFLNGLLCHARYFLPQLLYFSSLGHPVFTFHYRGTFESITNKTISFDQIYGDILAMIHQYFPQKKIHLIGHSMGALIALNFSIKNQEILKTITLLTCPYEVQSIFLGKRTMSSKILLEKFGKNLERFKITSKTFNAQIWKILFSTILNPEIVYQLGFYKKRIPKKIAEDYVKEFNSCGPEIFSTLFDEIYYAKQEDPSLISIPTLLIAALKDPLIPIENIYKLHKKIPQSSLHVFLEGRHLLQLEFSEEVNKKIQSFISSV